MCYAQLHTRRCTRTFPVKTKGRESYKSWGKNEKIKSHPERFQGCRDPSNVTFTCKERVYFKVVAELCAREEETVQPVHMINVDMEGTLEAATLGALILCELCQGLQQAEDMERNLAELLQEAKEKTGRCFLHTICFC